MGVDDPRERPRQKTYFLTNVHERSTQPRIKIKAATPARCQEISSPKLGTTGVQDPRGIHSRPHEWGPQGLMTPEKDPSKILFSN